MQFSSTGEFVILTTEEVRDILDRIVSHEIPLRRKRSDGEFSFIPPKDFDSYLRQREMLFYIDKKVYDKDVAAARNEGIIMQSKEAMPLLDEPASPAAPHLPPSAADDAGYVKNIKESRQMSAKERAETVNRHKNEIKKMMDDGRKFDARSMGETEKFFSSTLCLNKVTLEENIAGEMQNEHMASLVSETQGLIDNLISMMAKGKSSYRDLGSLEEIQTGSGTLNHMNRILIRFISFLFFYNGYFQKYSTEVKRFRAYFQKTFYPYYDKVTRGEQKLTLEVAFRDGIMPVRDRTSFIDYCMGGFLHDIGKMPYVDYHDGSAAYDPMKARRHVFDSYNLLVQSKLFSWGVVATGLLHHDYYNAQFGYQQNKTFRSRFEDRRGNSRDVTRTKYLVSYNVLDVAYDNAYSFFPTKMIELIDIYDAMTDTGKQYRTDAKSPEEALFEIKKCYLDGEHLGVDPVMFNIFVDFIKASGLITEHAFAQSVKI